jgi:hypothetical protein
MQERSEFWRRLWGHVRVNAFLLRKTFGPMLVFRSPEPWLSETWQGNEVLGCQGQTVYIGAFKLLPSDSWPSHVSVRIDFYTHPRFAAFCKSEPDVDTEGVDHL